MLGLRDTSALNQNIVKFALLGQFLQLHQQILSQSTTNTTVLHLDHLFFGLGDRFHELGIDVQLGHVVDNDSNSAGEGGKRRKKKRERRVRKDIESLFSALSIIPPPPPHHHTTTLILLLLFLDTYAFQVLPLRVLISVVFLQDVAHEGGLPSPQETTQEGDRDGFSFSSGAHFFSFCWFARQAKERKKKKKKKTKKSKTVTEGSL